MNLELVVLAALVAGLLLLVTTLGLQSSPGDATTLFRQPRRLFRSLIAMLVVMPVVAVALAYALDLDRAVKITLIALSLSPVPPFLPPKNIKVSGESSYAIGLLVVTGLLSIVYVPAALAVLKVVLNIPVSLTWWHVIVPVGWTIFAPLSTGLLIRRFAPRFAARVAPPAGRFAILLFISGVIPLMVISLPKAMPLIGNGTLFAMVLFCVVGLGVGHLLGGSTQGERATLALSVAARHPGVAMAIAQANFPGETLVLPAVLLYIVLNAIVTLPYTRLAVEAARRARS